MKTTYLINKLRPDGKLALSSVSHQEWFAVIQSNKGLPVEQRRYFMVDCIESGCEIDRMIIEITLEEFRRWNSQHTMSERNRKCKQQFTHLSLDAELSEKDVLCLEECLSDQTQSENNIVDGILMDELRDKLALWKPWANEMLTLYLSGRKRKCTKELAEKYGVSEQVIRKYKRQFEDFVKKYLLGVSF